MSVGKHVEAWREMGRDVGDVKKCRGGVGELGREGLESGELGSRELGSGGVRFGGVGIARGGFGRGRLGEFGLRSEGLGELGLGGRGAHSKFQRGGSKKNLILHSGATLKNFGRGDEILN